MSSKILGGTGHLGNNIRVRIDIPIKGVNCARSSHDIDKMEMHASSNFWVSPYGRFGTRWGTSLLAPIGISASGTGSTLMGIVRKSSTGTDFYSIRAIEYLPLGECYIVFAGRKVYTIPQTSRWGIVGRHWGTWETISTVNVRRAIPDEGTDGYPFYYMSDGCEWYSQASSGAALSSIADASVLAFTSVIPGGCIRYIGETNATTVDDKIACALFYSRLYVASGGNLQNVYKVTQADLDDHPHSPEDRAVDDIYIENVLIESLSNVAPDAAGSVAVRVNRLWVGERDGSRLWYSGPDAPGDWGWNGTGTDPSSPPLDGGSMSIDANDGANITGICNFKSMLAIFKSGIMRHTIHKIEGSLASESDPFYREQIADGMSARSEMCIATSGDDVLFASSGGMYSLELVDSVGNVGSVPKSLRINPILDDDPPMCMKYSPRYGVHFIILESNKAMLYHRGIDAWFPFYFSFSPSAVGCINDEVIIGTTNGNVLLYDRDVISDEVDSDSVAGKEITSSFYSRVFDFDQPNLTHFVERMSIAMLVKSVGRIYMDAIDEYGSEYWDAYNFGGDSINPKCSWDDSNCAWDSEESGWDRSGIMVVEDRIMKEFSNFQFAISTSAAIDILDIMLFGSYVGDKLYRKEQ